MNLLLIAAIVGLVGSWLRARALAGSVSRRRAKGAWEALAREVGMRLGDDSYRGIFLRDRVRGIEVAIFRTQVRLGEHRFCATATIEPRARLLVHHRDFDRPSSAFASVPTHPTGDAAFDREFVVRARRDPRLSHDARLALATLPCPELTLFDSRLALLWEMRAAVPSESEVEAVRAIVDVFAEARAAAYR